MGLAVGKGGKAYDATVERIDAAKEKLQDSIDTIMEQRRGETIANATDKRNADAALAKAQNDLAKLLANKRTKRGEMSMGDAKDAVDKATSMAMTTAERQHATKLSQYEAGERGRLKMAEPESREALQARVTTLLASSDPAVRAQGRRLRDSLEEVTKAATYRTAPGPLTPAIAFKSIGDISKATQEKANSPLNKETKGMSKEEKAKWAEGETRRLYEEQVRLFEAQMGIARGDSGAGAGAPTGGKVDPNNKFLK